jgi:hypothetical protein
VTVCSGTGGAETARSRGPSSMSSRLLFNPSLTSTEELESTFVGRHEILNRLEKDLLEDQKSRTPRHWQLIGPRGTGKTHLTELLSRHMRLRHKWRIARLPEENYKISSLGELLEQILIRADAPFDSNQIRDSRGDFELQERALDALRTQSVKTNQPLLVVLENLASLFERQLRSDRDQARLRDILTNNPPFILLATSTSQSDATTKHSAPLFEFFHTLVLDDLNRTEITALVRARADWEHNASFLADFDRVKDRIDAIYHLSGGNPRLAVALYRVLANGVTAELHDHILKLLDEVTPYYQARLNDIPQQAVRVLTEMAVSKTLATPAMIARRCRIPTNQATAQIAKLLDERLVVQGTRPDARSRYYEFKDRLLRIWIQMRESAGAARRLRFLAEFFDRWYAGRTDELEEVSRRTLSDFWIDLSEGDERRCSDRLKTLSYLADIRPGFDKSVVLRVMSAHVGESSEADVKEHINALQRMFESATDPQEREALAFLLAECYLATNREHDSRRYLNSVIDEGSKSEIIAGRYVSALVADQAFQEAWDFGNLWLARPGNHEHVMGDLGVAAFALGNYEMGLDLVSYRIEGLCSNCVEKLLRRVVTVSRSTQAPKSIETDIWARLIASDSSAHATARQIRAVIDVLASPTLAAIPVSAFLTAADAWTALSDAPGWLLGKSICGLAHRNSHASDTLRFIVAVAQRTSAPLGQFAVDHLVEILPSLRHDRNRDGEAAADFATAMALVRQRTVPDSLGTAFRLGAPLVAKRFPEFVGDIIALYTSWLNEDLLKEAIAPYSEAISVLDSADPIKTLQSFHSETREAVLLLLSSLAINLSHEGVDSAPSKSRRRNISSKRVDPTPHTSLNRLLKNS